jgi:hypothetical protein
MCSIVNQFQNLGSTLLLPFHSVSSAYLPPPRGTLTGMFNALVWSFDFDLRDMSNEVRVSAIDWLFLFVSYFLIGSFPWLLNGNIHIKLKIA